MSSSAERKAKIARQLGALLERHNLTARKLEVLTKKQNERDPKRPVIWAMTTHRILKGDAKTEANPQTLRKIAEALNEPFEQAFGGDVAPIDVVELVRMHYGESVAELLQMLFQLDEPTRSRMASKLCGRLETEFETKVQTIRPSGAFSPATKVRRDLAEELGLSEEQSPRPEPGTE
jgi:transcriptional regulator with XRE-family HTH domain